MEEAFDKAMNKLKRKDKDGNMKLDESNQHLEKMLEVKTSIVESEEAEDLYGAELD